MVEVIEGRWEEILARGSELQGLRVRVEVLPPANAPVAPSQTLAALAELERFTPTQEESEILDGFDDFRREHPLTLGDLRELD
jgi:hypothetical protein